MLDFVFLVTVAAPPYPLPRFNLFRLIPHPPTYGIKLKLLKFWPRTPTGACCREEVILPYRHFCEIFRHHTVEQPRPTCSLLRFSSVQAGTGFHKMQNLEHYLATLQYRRFLHLLLIKAGGCLSILATPPISPQNSLVDGRRSITDYLCKRYK